MAMYDSSNELFKDAISKGLIRISSVVIKVGKVNVEAPQAINVLDVDGWKDFLQNIVDKSDSDTEIHFAEQFLKSIPAIALERPRKKVISDVDVKKLTQNLEKCNTIDDVLDLIGANKKPVPDVLKWKRPTKAENNKLQYHCYNIDWYIERQEKASNVYYSIFNPEKREVARYDSLKDAKNSMINIIK
jgi:hypothetical protein